VRTNQSTRYEERTELTVDAPTLVEGLPGLGMVASIAVDQITTQLDLAQHGRIVSDDLPPVASFSDGRVRDPVRVYAGDDPAVMTLQSDVPVPPRAVGSLTECIMTEVAAEFDRAVLLAGAPAESEADIGDVVGIATTDRLERELVDAGIELADGTGIVGGVTGALLGACYERDVPAAVLVVRSNPYIPDPGAARAVIEDALEPLVDFDVDTRKLLDEAEEIQAQKRRIAEQLREYQQTEETQPSTPSMYQ
jgi:uncharacterized protein